ncbi:transglycosylase SLT domain-containing protein [Aliiroseovarius sp. S1339]|uniref:transglycosylase SLT domain-containing protein n=1 Tax=Aliiroseovarius sp. S1339 TaxID=2936990 RepID=UPI0020BE0465|nr:transglycosylase SLT domain-containing protein [Aliiroseovarius sp. S1339]MCK8464122.1 transglycosylase SLT domain-containing protein [Aliiroseovarius sp. S1339]
MSRLLRAALILVFVASCGGDSKAPRNLNNACSIINQRPNIHRAMKRTERKWKVPVPVLMAMIYQESKFIRDARTPMKYALGVLPMGRQSSAYGYAQALDATWKEYQRAEGGRGARRTDIKDATDFMGWYMNETRAKTGIPLTDARNQYLAYHEGRTGYLRGSYKSKSWLVRIASEVNARAILYQHQLATCRR